MSTFASGPERRVGALELPPDTSEDVLALLAIAAGPATADEIVGQPSAVAAFLAQRVELPEPRRRISVRAVQVAAGATVASVVLGGGLAAADVLPTPAQRLVSRALGTIGIDVPSPDRPQAAGPASRPASRDSSSAAAGPADLPARETVTHPLLSYAGVVAPFGTALDAAAGAGPDTAAAASSSGDAPARAAGSVDTTFTGSIGASGSSTEDATGNGNSGGAGNSQGNANSGGNGGSAPSAGGGSSATGGSKAQGYGPGGNPSRGRNGTGTPASNAGGSPAKGKTAVPSAAPQTRIAAPGQARQASELGQPGNPAAGSGSD